MTENGFKEKKTSRGRGLLFIFFALLTLTASVFALIGMQKAREASMDAEAQAREKTSQAGPVVRIVRAQRGSAERHIELPGEARPYNEVTIYAKLSGYMRELKVDYGDPVKTGQLIAVLESPELDRQYDAAVSDMKNKEAMAKRGRELLPQHVVSMEDAQTREAAAQVAKATVESLAAQKEYEIIRAPLSGTVTARYVDPGALIQNAGNSQGTASPVVTVSRVDRLKVYAYASQKDAGYINVGDHAEIRDGSRPDVRVQTSLSRTGVQLDARTRTLLLEFDVDNSKGTIVSGSFVQVSMNLKTPAYVEIPVGVLVFQANKPFAAVLAEGNKAGLRPIVIAESDGKIVKVASGVEEGERLILYGGGSLSDGSPVQPKEEEAKG